MLIDQCKELGIKKRNCLFFHSSIRAVGGGVKVRELIEALFCAVGKDGTLLFPTFIEKGRILRSFPNAFSYGCCG